MPPANALQQQWTRLKPGDRRALVIVTAFLGVVFGYVYLIEPLLIRYELAQSELAELGDQQRRFEQQARMLPRRELRLAEYRAQLASLNRRFDLHADSAEAAVSKVINELSYYARLTEVAVSGIRPLETEPSGGYREVMLEVEAAAGYDPLHEFFYYIETSPSLLAITDLDLSTEQTPAGPSLTARFKLSNIIRLETTAGAPAAALPDPSHPLRLLISRWTGYAPLAVAKHNGYLDSAGRRVELLLTDDRVTAERLLVSGEADGIGTSMPELLSYWAKGIPLKIVLPLASAAGTEGIVVRADSPIRTVADLRGRPVAVDPQGLLQFVLAKALATADMGLNDVTIKALGPAQVARQIASGTLEAGLTREPFLSSLTSAKQARQIYASEPLRGLLVDVLAVTPEAIDGKAEALQFLIDGLVKAQRDIAAQPEQARAIVAEWEGQEPALTAASMAKLTLYDPAQTEAFFTPERLAAGLALFEAYLEDTGQPLPLVTAEDIADADFFSRAAAAPADATDGPPDEDDNDDDGADDER